MKNITRLIFVFALLWHTKAVPIILKESSPSGEAIIAISSSDPDIKKYIDFNYPNESGRETISKEDLSDDTVGRSFSFVTPGGAVSGTGRGFVSTSAFNPFLLPLFFNPINFEGIGLSNFDSLNNWFRGAEGIYEPGFGGNGEVQTVSAVNDNGHVYGNVKTITFDNRSKGSN